MKFISPLPWSNIIDFEGSSDQQEQDPNLQYSYSGSPSPWDDQKYYDPFEGMEEFNPVQPNSGQTVPNSSESPTDYSFVEYLEGLLASVGAENEITRKFNSAEAELQRKWASEENQKSRAWQTEMANSAYQRAVTDLRAAGINPILAAQGAASTGSAGVISGSSASSTATGGDTLSSLINALANVASSVAEFLPDVSKLFKNVTVSKK